MTILRDIATRAAATNLKFLLSGGHAVISHGYARNTFDLDLIVLRDDQEQWRKLLAQSGYHPVHQAMTFIQFQGERDGTMPVDLMLVNGETFTKLLTEAVSAPGTTAIKVVSLRHLLALKCHAVKHGHSGRIVKDADDLINLVSINRINLEDDAIRDIFLRHGTPDLYEKVRRATRRE